MQETKGVVRACLSVLKDLGRKGRMAIGIWIVLELWCSGLESVQENVLLDAKGHVKVTDFGLAKGNMTDEMRTNSFIGTME